MKETKFHLATGSLYNIFNLEHTVNVMVDGWAKYGPWRPR